MQSCQVRVARASRVRRKKLWNKLTDKAKATEINKSYIKATQKEVSKEGLTVKKSQETERNRYI
jgi:hypothetical protein